VRGGEVGCSLRQPRRTPPPSRNDMANLSSREYWDSRYTIDPLPFDWFCRYSTHKPLQDAVAAHLAAEARVLILGAGSSRLAEELLEARVCSGCVNLDFSQVVINQLNERHRCTHTESTVSNLLADVTSMSDVDDASFDVILDKATFDSVICGDGGAERAERMLAEVCRVLRPAGVFMLLSNAPPDERTPLFEHKSLIWTLSTQTVPKPAGSIAGSGAALADAKNLYLYTMVKAAAPPAADDQDGPAEADAG
jgi:ubiquinone/menaquinone biosynthesis C-methylase UbiE